MNKTLKITVLSLFLALGIDTASSLQAQVMSRSRSAPRASGANVVTGLPRTRELKKDNDSVQLDKGKFDTPTQDNGTRQIGRSRSTFNADNKDVARLPDSRAPEKQEPARPRAILKKVVF